MKDSKLYNLVTPFFNHRVGVVLILLICLAFLLRVGGGLSTMMFTYDQARDAFYAESITHGHLKILGPTTDIPGLNHGPFFYYLLAPLYVFAQGDPRAVLLAMILINLISFIPLGLLTQSLFRNYRITLLATLLFSVSYEAISYARWLSNPPISLVAIAFFYFAIWKIINQKKVGYLIAGIAAGVAVQTEVFLIYLIPIGVFGVIAFQSKAIFWDGKNIATRLSLLVNRYSLAGLAIFAVIVSTYFMAEIKFGYKGAKGLLQFFVGQGSHNLNFVRVDNYLKGWHEIAERNLTTVYPSASLYVILLVGLGVIVLYRILPSYRRQISFCLFLCLSPLPIFVLTEHFLTFINIGIMFPFLILVSLLIVQITKKVRLLTIFILFALVANLAYILPLTSRGNLLFQVQAEFRLQDQMAVVMESYKIANKQPFSLAAVTNPLYVPTTWAYLYHWLGKRDNQTIPPYHGDTELTYVGDQVFLKNRKIFPLEFFIIEPEIDNFWQRKLLGEEVIRTNLVVEKKFNRTILQVRQQKLLESTH